MTEKLKLNEEAVNRAISDLADKFAREIGALADILENWRKPEVARRVVESLLNRDRDAFNAVLDPMGGDDGMRIARCYQLLLLAEKLGQPKFTRGPEVCRLKTDLTRDQLIRYLVIARRFGEAQIWVDKASGLAAAGTVGPVIQPGPFLDALKAEGLVNCEPDTTVLSLEPYAGVFHGLKDFCGFQL